jgi:hypothetical protein
MSGPRAPHQLRHKPQHTPLKFEGPDWDGWSAKLVMRLYSGRKLPWCPRRHVAVWPMAVNGRLSQCWIAMRSSGWPTKSTSR